MNIDRALNGLLRLAIAVAVIGGSALAVVVVLDRMATEHTAAERRALLQRNAELNSSAVAPGSALACLDGGAGETIENACEKAVFANPQSAAGAVAYTAARLSLLSDAQRFSKSGDGAIMDAFTATRRALELDRFGLAAHVLATRDGCTAERCPVFTWLHETAVVKANLKGDVFSSYVDRYAAAWGKGEPDKPVPVASSPAPAEVASATVATAGHTRLSSKYDFPSSASIPPVSIMNAEPPLPKAATDAQAAQPKSEQIKPESAAAPAPAPVPPKRPQAQAAPAPAR